MNRGFLKEGFGVEIFLFLTAENGKNAKVGFTGRGVDGLAYTNLQPYSKRA